MWWFKSVPKVSPKRLAQLEAELGDVQIQLDWIRKQVRDLNSRLSTVQRQQKHVEDAPQEAIDDPAYHEDLSAPPRFPVPRPAETTAHLARRFRGG
jgi:hypothetical protein